MSGFARRMGYGLAGAVATKVARNATRRALHLEDGEPRLPRAARESRGLLTAVALAAAAGVAMALADLLREQRRRAASEARPIAASERQPVRASHRHAVS